MTATEAMGPRMSAVVLVYNQAPYVEAALRSLLAQTVPVQIVVCDDGSSDASAEIARAVLDNAGWPHGAKLIANPVNLGVSSAYALAMDECRCDWVMINDGDDISDPHRAERLLETFRRSPVDLVASAATPIDTQGARISAPFFWRVDEDKILDTAEVDEHARWSALGATMAFRRDLWTRFGAQPTKLVMCDKAMTHRALAGRGIQLLKEPLVHYRVRSEGLTHSLTYWSVPRSVLRKKLFVFVANNDGLVEELDRILAAAQPSAAVERLFRIRESLVAQTKLVRVSLDFPRPRAFFTLVRGMIAGRSAFERAYARRCLFMAIDPTRHELWLRGSMREIARRLLGKLTRGVAA